MRLESDIICNSKDYFKYATVLLNDYINKIFEEEFSGGQVFTSIVSSGSKKYCLMISTCLEKIQEELDNMKGPFLINDEIVLLDRVIYRETKNIPWLISENNEDFAINFDRTIRIYEVSPYFGVEGLGIFESLCGKSNYCLDLTSGKYQYIDIVSSPLIKESRMEKRIPPVFESIIADISNIEKQADLYISSYNKS